MIKAIAELPSIPHRADSAYSQLKILAALVLNNLWRVRNEVKFQAASPNPWRVTQRILVAIAEYARSKLSAHEGDLHFWIPLNLKWKPSDRGKIKHNTYAAFKEGKSTASVVARDGAGGILLVWMGTIHASSPE